MVTHFPICNLATNKRLYLITKTIQKYEKKFIQRAIHALL